MRRFYLYPRSGIWYAALIDPKTGQKLTGKSTGQRDKDDARDIAREWIKTGLPSTATAATRPIRDTFTFSEILSTVRSATLTPKDAEKIAETLKVRGLLLSFSVPGGPGAELFTDFLTRFWTYDKSPYIAEKLAHGQRITKEHCTHSLGRVKLHWFPSFNGKRLAELSKGDIKDFSLSLASEKTDLAPASINAIMIAGTAPLRWAYENGLISEDITKGLVTFAGKSRKRGILTPDEAQALLALNWGTDKRAYVASMVSATTGLRAGEVRALKAEDIGEAVLFVRHCFTDDDGLKSPKNGDERRVPLLPTVRAELLGLLADSPHGDEGYIFWSLEDSSRPCSIKTLTTPLFNALIRLHTGKDKPTPSERVDALAYWRGRNVTFHSWRHFYAARMADKVEARELMLATGHKTRAVFDHYADHALEENLASVGRAEAIVFENILPFRAVSGASA
jgi:integrase